MRINENLHKNQINIYERKVFKYFELNYDKYICKFLIKI